MAIGKASEVLILRLWLKQKGVCWCDASHLYVRGVPLTVPPGACDAREGAVRVVELVAVGAEEECRVGLLRRREKERNQCWKTFFFQFGPNCTVGRKM